MPLFLTLIISSFVTFWNLFGFPSIAEDEGVYVGQAWWLVHFGQITPYTYWYDHFPFGWLLIGLFQKLAGGPFAFGLAVFTGRVFIGLISIITTFILYKLVKFMTQSDKLSALSSFLFTLSPLALFFHRRVLLDNIATLFLLIALLFLFTCRGKLINFFLTGLFAGLAFLSKESTLFFFPAFLISAHFLSHPTNRRHSVAILATTFLWLVILFPLLAIIKREFLPASPSGPEHVSFIQALLFQAGRTGENFSANLGIWLKKDFYFTIFGFWAIFVNLLFGKLQHRLLAIFAIFYCLFLIRGGVVFDFYIIPLLPFLAICLTTTIQIIQERAGNKLPINFKPALYLILFVLFIGVSLFRLRDYLTIDATRNHREMVNYIKTSLDPNSVLVTDFSIWPDLRLAGYYNTEWFFKVEQDKEVRNLKLNNDPNKINYILLSLEMAQSLNSPEFPFLNQAFTQSNLLYDLPPILSPKAKNTIEDRLLWGDDTWLSLYKL